MQAAKSVGQTLRTFQPTIKEVVSVGQELKGSLEKELGLNELRDAARPVPRVPGKQGRGGGEGISALNELRDAA